MESFFPEQGPTAEEDSAAATTTQTEELDGVNAEDLLRLIQEEEDQHDREMLALSQEEASLRQIINMDQKDLATEIQELVKRQDQQESTAQQMNMRRSFQSTGCGTVDACLDMAQPYLHRLFHPSKNLLGAVTGAAKRSIQIPQAQQKACSVAFVFHSEYQGLRSWCKEHIPRCPRCASIDAAIRRREASFRPASISGLSAAPRISAIPGKQAYSLLARILQRNSRNNQERDEMFFPLFRCGVDLRMRHSSHLSASEMLQKIESFCNNWMNRLLTKCIQESTAVWSENSDAASVSPAMEMFFNSLTVQAEARPVGAQGKAIHRDPNTALDESQLHFHLRFIFSSPLHVDALTPFLAVMTDAASRRVLLLHIVQPLLLKMSSLFDDSEKAAFPIETSVRAVEALWGIVDRCSGFSASPVSRLAFFEQWYAVLQSLAVYSTTLQADFAVPSVPDPNPVVGTGEAGEPNSPNFVRRSFSVIKSLLHFLSPPPSPPFPPRVDPKMVDCVVFVRNVPKPVMEELGTFFVAQSSSQSSVLDFFVSSKTKVNMGLNLFSEFCVDIYRPYHGSSDVIVGGGQSRQAVSSCTPFLRMTPEVIKANQCVAQGYRMLLEVIEKAQQKAEELHKTWYSTYQSKETIALDALERSEFFQEMCREFESLSLEEKSWSCAKFDVLLPLHQFDAFSSEESRDQPVLYASFKTTKTN